MENPSFRLEGVIKTKEDMEDFEGPLSLILMLLAKNKIEIRDIRIAEILDQYLAYLAEMQHMDLEVASEFVQMASHLVYIKTKTLLAGTEEVSELEELMSSLEQLKNRDRLAAVKQIAPALGAALERGALLFSAPGETLPRYGEYDYRHEGWELLAALASMSEKGVSVPEEEARVAVPKPIVYSARRKGGEIIRLLSDGRAMPLRELYAMASSRSELVATFISILEMCLIGSVCLDREGDEYTVRFTGGDAEQILESFQND